MKKTIVALVLLIITASVAWGDSTCEVIKVSLYEKASGGMVLGNGAIIGQSSTPCATITIQMIDRGSGLDGKITAYFIGSKPKNKEFNARSIFPGELHTESICWKRSQEMIEISCAF